MSNIKTIFSARTPVSIGMTGIYNPIAPAFTLVYTKVLQWIGDHFMSNSDSLYHYRAKVLSVYDGDTVTLMIDMGLKHFARVKVRLIGIDTPEIRTRDKAEKALGLAARDYLSDRILDKDVIVHTVEKGKFGRWLGRLWLPDDGEQLGESLNEEMIRAGHAKPYNGGAR